jgi:hypothetical protein
LGRRSGELLGCPIEQGDAPAGPDAHHPAHGLEDFPHLLVDLHHARVSLRVPHRNRRLVGERGEQVGIVAEIRITRPLGAEGEEADKRVLFNQGCHHRALK